MNNYYNLIITLTILLIVVITGCHKPMTFESCTDICKQANLTKDDKAWCVLGCFYCFAGNAANRNQPGCKAMQKLGDK